MLRLTCAPHTVQHISCVECAATAAALSHCALARACIHNRTIIAILFAVLVMHCHTTLRISMPHSPSNTPRYMLTLTSGVSTSSCASAQTI